MDGETIGAYNYFGVVKSKKGNKTLNYNYMVYCDPDEKNGSLHADQKCSTLDLDKIIALKLEQDCEKQKIQNIPLTCHFDKSSLKLEQKSNSRGVIRTR